MSGWNEVDKPKTGGLFLQVEDGETKRVRILDEEPHTAYVHKISQTKDGEETFISVPATRNLDEDYINANTKRYPETAQHCLRVAEYDDDGEVLGIKILAGGVQVFRPLKQFWQRHGDITKYDVDISRTGTKKKTEYTVSLAPDSNEIDLDAWKEEALSEEWSWDNVFPEVTPDEQRKMVERAKIDIEYDPAEEIAAEMEVDEALATRFTFGKYGPDKFPPKGKTVGEVMVIDAGWVEWASENVTSDDTIAAACRVAVRHMDQLPAGKPQKAVSSGSKSRAAANAGSKSTAKGKQEKATPEAKPKWTMNMTPEQYLEKFPQGPKAAIARQLVEGDGSDRRELGRQDVAKFKTEMDRSGLIAQINEAFEGNPDYSDAMDIVEAVKKHGNGKTRMKDLTDAQLTSLLEEIS